MRNVAFVPIRAGSVGVPMKNIKSICGKPLVYWKLLALEHTPEVDLVIVATDSDLFEQTVLGFNFSKVKIFRRSAESARDDAPVIDVILETISKSGLINNKDIFIQAEATALLVLPNSYSDGLTFYKEGGYDSVQTAVRKVLYILNEDGTPKNYDVAVNSNRQTMRGDLILTGDMVISSVLNIVENKKMANGNKIGVYEMPEHHVIDIDEEWDFIIAEKMMERYVLPYWAERGLL